MKSEWITILVLVGLGGMKLSSYLDEKEQKQKLEQAKVDAEIQVVEEAKHQIGRRVTSSCSDALEKFVAPNAKVLDWIDLKDRNTGERQAYRYYERTSTGYRQELRATVSGHTSFLRMICFTDADFRVIDAQYAWLN